MNIEIVVLLSGLLPVFGLGYVVIYPLTVNFDSITTTHCRVTPILPYFCIAVFQVPLYK